MKGRSWKLFTPLVVAAAIILAVLVFLLLSGQIRYVDMPTGPNEVTGWHTSPSRTLDESTG